MSIGFLRFPQVFCGFLRFFCILGDFWVKRGVFRGHSEGERWQEGSRDDLEEGLFGFGLDGSVEEVDEGGGEAEVGGDVLGEGGLEGAIEGESGGGAPLAVEEEVEGGVVGGEAFGGSGELEAIELGEGGAELFGGDDAAVVFVVVEEVAADGEELLALGHVDARGDGEGFAVDLEVVAAAGGLLEALAGPPGGDVVLVGALVVREADVAVDAHGDLLRRADVVRGEVEEVLIDLGDEGEHGGFELALVEGLALVEPGAVVVALEGAEELGCGGGEVGGHGV
jgi:hypothetical protein